MYPSSKIQWAQRGDSRGGCTIYVLAWWPSADWLSVLQITNPSLEILDKDSVPVMPTGTASTSRITDSEAYRTIAYWLILTLPAKPRTHPAPSSILWTTLARPMNLLFPEKEQLVLYQTKNRPPPPTLPWYPGPCHPLLCMVNFPLHLHQNNSHRYTQGYKRNGHST